MAHQEKKNQGQKGCKKGRRSHRPAAITAGNKVKRLRRAARDAEFKLGKLERRLKAGKEHDSVGFRNRVKRLESNAKSLRAHAENIKDAVARGNWR